MVGRPAQNHPLQVARRGALDQVDDRGTHPDEFAKISRRYGPFTLDVAASAANTKCSRYFTLADDGLAQSWSGEAVWCNPPYSDLRVWVAKAWDEWGSDAPPSRIAMLLPANRTEQGWWQDLVEPHRTGPHLEVSFLRGRMRFLRAEGVPVPRGGDRPPFGCCLLVWSR